MARTMLAVVPSLLTTPGGIANERHEATLLLAAVLWVFSEQ